MRAENMNLEYGWWHSTVIGVFEFILLIGAVMTAIVYGLRRIYRTARTVEQIFEFQVSEKKARESLDAKLSEHITSEEARDERREREIHDLAVNVREITREIRPNGGSSMKDVLNKTAEHVHNIQTQVAVLEEWKRSSTKT
jgi:hypothetical protein